MQKILLAIVAITLGACAHQPYTPAPKIAPLNIGPVKTGNKEISTGNKAIAAGNEAVRSKLEDTRAKLDKAIITANELTIDRETLRSDLAAVGESLNAALWENATLKTTINDQDARITKQDDVINDLFKENEARQQVIDKQTAELNRTLQENADLALIKKQVNAYWGLGAFLYGAKRLGWRLLLVAVVLMAIVFVLNLFVPAFGPIFSAIIKFLIGIPGRIARFVTSLFRRKPPS